MLDAVGVVKRYGDHEALRGVSLQVGPGEVCGLLGPNGAGKTTLVSIVAGLRRPDSGSVSVDGVDVVTGGRRARMAVGLAAQETGIYPTVSVRGNVELFGRLAGLAGRDLDRRIDEVAEILELTDLLGRPARNLSGGEKRRVHTAMAMVHRPRLLMLDEPTTGVDVATRARLLDAVAALAAHDGCSVLYSTHYLPEIEQLGASVAILDHGRILARGSQDDLIAEHGSGLVELTFDGPAPAVDGAIVDGSTVRIATDRPGPTAAAVTARLGAAAEHLESVELLRPSLESVFLAVTGKPYAQDDDLLDAGAPGASGDGVRP